MPIEDLDLSTEAGIEQAMKRMAEEEGLGSFKSAEDMTEDELVDECFLDECDEDATLSEDELLEKYEDETKLE